MDKYIFINFQRRGDILQSFPLILSLKKKIFYLTFEEHSDVLKIDNNNIIPITFKLYELFSKFNNLSEAFNFIKSFFININNFFFDFSINLNFSFLSALIHSTIKSKTKLGPTLLNEKEIFISNRHLQLLFSDLKNCKNHDHILNYYFRALNILPDNFIISKYKYEKSFKKIIIHPGASKEKKKWGIENYFKLINILSKEYKNCLFIITGSKQEASENFILEKKLMDNKINYKNLTGKLTILSLLDLIKDSDLLISSDTLIQHLSALTSIKSITIFLGGGYHYHTFPYQLNKIILAPDIDCYPCEYASKCYNNYKCRNKIQPEMIVDVLRGKKIKNSYETILKENLLQLT